MGLELEERFASEIKELLGDWVLETKVQKARSIFVVVKPEEYKESIRKTVQKYGIAHISTMTGADSRQAIEVMSHLSYQGMKITVKTAVPKTSPEIDSISDILPAATVYEREVYDLLGVKFKGHPNLTRLVLPDDWPEDEHPLRKEYKVVRPEPIRKA